MTLRTARHDVHLIADLLTTAEAEARALGDAQPGAEHLLLAALLVGDSSARDALALDAATVREAITATHSDALASVEITTDASGSPLPPARGVYRSEVSTQEVFQRARRLSRRSSSGLRSAHVLLAVAEREHGTAARVLQRLGLERASVIEATQRELTL